MILADTNIWLALSLSSHIFHSTTRAWYATQTTPGAILFCRSTQQSVLRLLTTESVIRRYGIPALTNNEAWQAMEGFLADPRVGWAGEPEGIDSRWKQLAVRRAASPKLWMDAYLAAFAMAGGYELITTDQAFTQFRDLNPIVLA